MQLAVFAQRLQHTLQLHNVVRMQLLFVVVKCCSFLLGFVVELYVAALGGVGDSLLRSNTRGWQLLVKLRDF